MATATATIAATNVDRAVVATGGGWEFDGTILLAGDYASGGVPLDFGPTFSQQGQGVVDYVHVVPTAGYVFNYDKTNKKLKVMMGDNNNASDGPGVEHAAATLDSALTGGVISVYVRGR